MKVVSVKIHNILGIEDFEITPKEINRFEGRNSTGKTSTLEAIKAALKGGHDATLLRNGSDEGQIVILLDDGLEIKKTVTGEKTSLSVKYPRSGVKVEQPQTRLNELVDALSINPVDFLMAPAAKRAEFLLQAMPLKVTQRDLDGICSGFEVDVNDHAFTVLAAIEKLIYDERTGVNRLKDEKRKTAKQLGETLPLEEDPTDWATKATETTQALAEAKSDLKNARTDIDRHDADTRAMIASTRKEQGADIQKQYAEKLKALDEWRFEELTKINEAEKTALAEADKWFKNRIEESSAILTTPINKLTASLAEAATKAKQQTVFANTRKMIAQHEDEALRHEADSDGLTARLEALDRLRLRILANLPIPGVTVKDGQVVKDGVTYDRLNTAQQIEIAVAIAKLRAKDLGIVCVDGLECLDEENFAAFEAAMQGSGLQCFITRVTNTPMEVTTK